MKNMYYIDAPCGAGKTTAMTEYLAEAIHLDKRFVVLVPTIDLLKQIEQQLIGLGVTNMDMVAIHSEQAGDSVTKRLHKFLTKTGGRKILLVTFEGWKNIQRRAPKGWILIVDEAIPVFQTSQIKSPLMAPHLLKYLEFGQPDSAGYRKVTILQRHKNAVKKILHEQDEAYEAIKPTASRLLLNMQTSVSAQQFESFNNQKSSELVFYHVIRPRIFRGFDSVTMMSANFTDSAVFLIWKFMGIKFQQKFGFGSKKIASSHPREVGETLDIYHLDVDWSLERKKKHAAIFQDEFSRAVKEIFDGEPFIYTINGSDNPHMFQNLPNGIYVPPKAHGSNSYRTFHNAAVYAHFNQSADRVGFLMRKFNLSEKQAWDLLNYDYYYQFICRTSLREFPLHLSVVVPSRKIILMDKDMAYYIHLIFTGSRLHHFKSSLISSIPKVTRGRKSVGTHAVSAYDRLKKHRKKIEYDDLQRKFKILSRKPLDQCINLSTRFDNEITLKRIDNEKRRWSLALVGKIKSADFKTIEYDQWNEVVAELEIKSKRTLRSKNSNSLFSMAQFKEENGRPLNRQLSSVVQVHALLMDMDSDQNCDPEAFANLFAGTKMVMYSSFNSSLTDQRYRVIIPFSHPVDVTCH